MQLRNTTKMNVHYTMGLRPDGRELIVVVVKGTFAFPTSGQRVPRLLPEQPQLVMADEFTGEPGYSATVVEADFVPNKPRAEVLLNGSAYAPDGKPTHEVVTSLRVGNLLKEIRVVGNRFWRQTSLGPRASEPEAFVRMPISYDNAFGGIDDTDDRGAISFSANPFGKGFFAQPRSRKIDGRALPNTEERNKPIIDPKGSYRPMSYGPISRLCEPRCRYAGTYDAAWKANQFPFLPTDFNELYYQSSPVDQQLDDLNASALIELSNLTPDGQCQIQLPGIHVPVEFQLRDGELVEQEARLDTLLIESDKRLFSMIWRASLPIKKNIFEVSSALVGRMPNAWYRARQLGKTYFASLEDLTAESF